MDSSEWTEFIRDEGEYILSLQEAREEALADIAIIQGFIYEVDGLEKKAQKRLKKAHKKRDKSVDNKYDSVFWQQRKMAMEIGYDPVPEEHFQKKLRELKRGRFIS